ncbi:outer membrane protein assembly factor BamD [Niabella pedocola]|uniref:Outer membrane protein assembly factor BamD n=1 Tax=Niabella pedocola TaxID=1752077 RepID=A0ABS8PQY4_9BACT|nr:outer membrane protein assembly factor BamD [Niabella pedocola]MCD2423495.1 outer membrane protein assembly factor BamD [Niabella pedocola]
MRFFVIISALFLMSSCGPGMNKILKSKDAAYKLKMADAFYAKKKYNKAQLIYEDILPYYKTTPQFQDIYYKYAYSAYYQHDYAMAENYFKTFMESFPNSPKFEEMEYMRAYNFYKQSPKPELDQSNTFKAIGAMQTFINTHPSSVRLPEANRILDELRSKLEIKDYKSAKLYYDMGYYRAAGVSFAALLENFPESQLADEYKMMSVKSYYLFAENSVIDKKTERFREVMDECKEFIDRFPESKYKADIEKYMAMSQSQIQKFSNNEQIKKAS